MALLMVPASPMGIEFDSYTKRYFIIIIFLFCLKNLLVILTSA